MNYVISDLHGCYDLFFKMLDKINFSDNDTLYLLGDMIDRGPDGISILQDVMYRSNVIPFFGNHEDMLYRMIRKQRTLRSDADREEMMKHLQFWETYNGGKKIWADYCALTSAQQQELLDYLETFTVYDEVSAGGNTFLLAHAGVGEWEAEKDPNDCELRDFIWGKTDYDRVYYREKYLVTGHRPTALIDKAYTGRIIQKNRHVAIDCGAVFLGTLGCFCLETMEETYVSRKDKNPTARNGV